MTLVALISNPRSTGNKALLPAVRDYCARNPDIFHYEVEEVHQIADALRAIALVKPSVLVINGGDGTVQATLTELYHGGHFGKTPPAVAVLPNGKTNLIALDLGARGKPLATLDRIVEIAKTDLESHIVVRQLIALSDGEDGRPVLGMFMGGAGLAEIILYCRQKIYPLGLPNSVSHFIAAVAGLFTMLFGLTAKFLPITRSALRISYFQKGELNGSFIVVMVTTLEKLLLGSRAEAGSSPTGQLKFIAVEHNRAGLTTMLIDTLMGRFGTRRGRGVHLAREDMIRIDSDRSRSRVVLDGEIFEASAGKPIILRSTDPVPFLRLAA
jgi:diacylglycerol kinase family enzyme